MIPYGKQEIDQQDIDAVIEVLKSDFLTQGPKVPMFEDALCAYTGADHSVSFINATSALIAACRSLGLAGGDWLWTSPISFVASANCALHCGANIDFVDIDPETYNLCPDMLEAKLQDAQKINRLPKIVIPVHMGGQSCDMGAIKLLADKYGFLIIEDASHAIGGKYNGRHVGCCELSDVTIFSFHPVKIITSGEGGVALTNNKNIADKMRLLCSHGITRFPSSMTKPSDGGWYYQQIELGYNFRMPDILAALGLSQLKKISDFIQKRHRIADRYFQALSGLPLQLPKQNSNIYSSYHLFIIRLNLIEIGLPKEIIYDQLRARGVGVNVHYIPIHTQPYYKSLGFSDGDFPKAEQYYNEALSIPIFHHMSVEQQSHVISVLKDILEAK